ncbi:hypothetical protein [Stenotrophomonas rhizophila]|uniref:hypothetical protein n=1 Tax=Stenotrophomonas rhizophila TaxID=216778 RepID=UPI0028D4F19C|nr:hypothetical protein [Stenotrophomonas rhizophila]
MARTIKLLGVTLWPPLSVRLRELGARVDAAANSITTTTAHVLPALNERIDEVDRAAGTVTQALDARVIALEQYLTAPKPAAAVPKRKGARAPARRR